jgi:hypothetical protein
MSDYRRKFMAIPDVGMVPFDRGCKDVQQVASGEEVKRANAAASPPPRVRSLLPATSAFLHHCP